MNVYGITIPGFAHLEVAVQILAPEPIDIATVSLVQGIRIEAVSHCVRRPNLTRKWLIHLTSSKHKSSLHHFGSQILPVLPRIDTGLVNFIDQCAVTRHIMYMCT